MFKIESVNKDVCLKLNKLNFGQFKEELFNNIQFDCINKMVLLKKYRNNTTY